VAGLRAEDDYAQDGAFMLVGLNAGFGKTLAADWPFISSTGFGVVRQGFGVEIDDATLHRLTAEFVGRPIRLLALLGGGKNQTAEGGRIEPHQFAALGTRVVRSAAEVGLRDVLIEVGNEPDIGHPDYAKRPRDFAMAVARTHAAVRQAGHTGIVVSGGISNLSRERLDYLERVVSQLSPDIVVGFHRYPHGLGPEQPHPGFADRDAEWLRLKQIAGSRQVACTEFGHHTARRRYRRLGFFRQRRRVSEEAVAEHIVYDLRYFRDHGCLLSAVYQLNDGPTDRPIDRYGIRRADGTPKPAVAAIAEFVRELKVKG